MTNLQVLKVVFSGRTDRNFNRLQGQLAALGVGLLALAVVLPRLGLPDWAGVAIFATVGALALLLFKRALKKYN